MPKRVLNRIRLDKIAAVDLPCQEHATVAIIKRAAINPNLVIAKKTFQEALNAQLVSEKISDTFWRAFENQWAVRDAFRVALTDEISEGGSGDDAISGFTAAMQQIATLAADAAREAASTADTDLESAVEDAVSKWLQTKEQPMSKYTTKAALLSAATSFVLAKATAAEMTEIVDGAVELDAVDELPAAQTELVAAAKAKKGTGNSPELAKALTEIAILKLSPEGRSHYETLDETGKAAFISKSAPEQLADIEKANSADPVMFKCKDGTEIRKSDGAVALMMAKRLDAQDETIAKLSGDLAGSSIEKRAAKYTNVATDVATDMLKSASQIGEDTAAGKAIIKSLDAMNKSRSTLFKSLGTSEGGEAPADITKARSDYNAEVSAVMKRDDIGRSDAMSKVRMDRPDLFKAAYPENAEEDEDA